MTKNSLKDRLPLEIQEKLAKLRGASTPLANKSARRRKGKKRDLLPGYLRKEASDLSLADQESKKKAREQFIAAQTWLKNTFPKAFNFKDPKPLKVNIEKDISQTECPFSRTLIHKVVSFYVNHTSYLESIVQENGRFDLQGEKAGKVRQAEKNRALRQLEEREPHRQQKEKGKDSQKTKEGKGQDQHGIITRTNPQA
jgi:ProP effector